MLPCVCQILNGLKLIIFLANHVSSTHCNDVILYQMLNRIKIYLPFICICYLFNFISYISYFIQQTCPIYTLKFIRIKLFLNPIYY